MSCFVFIPWQHVPMYIGLDLYLRVVIILLLLGGEKGGTQKQRLVLIVAITSISRCDLNIFPIV